jgi:hypothetical protein
MKLHFEFESINLGPHDKIPMIEIYVNDQCLYSGAVMPELTCHGNLAQENCLCIAFTNKQDMDTVCDSENNIIKDMNFSLAKLSIDDQDLEELIWQGTYEAADRQYPGCLYFGPPGRFVLRFSSPVLRWILETRYKATKQDPNWEEDYNYYVNACKILNKL